MQGLAGKHHLKLRPHAKTHKSLEIARRQIALGAVGLTVATVEEALVFFEAGVQSLTISRPILSSEKLDRLFSTTGCHEQISLVVDSETGIDLAAARAAHANGVVNLFLKVDVGLHRCGVDPSGKLPLELSQRIGAHRHLRFQGILSHAGHAYSAGTKAAAAEIAEAERQTMIGVRKQLAINNINVPILSVGSTPTILATTNFEGIDEVRPGNYAFMDLLPYRLGEISYSDIALTVLATVISKNADFFITDAGSKTLTSDMGGHGLGSAKGYGLAFPVDKFLSADDALTVEALSEEHGKLRRGAFDLPLGSQVRILPNHSCPIANLAKELVVIESEGGIARWPIDASRCSK
jgi:D-serine deaminase-like pyridoxal phosphate-dependent protein